MNKTTAFALCLAYGGSVLANPLTYPKDHQWNFTVGAQSGVESFHLRFLDRDIPGADYEGVGDAYGMGIAFNLNQSFGYGKWFYLQMRESFTIATTTMLPSDREDDNESRSKGVYFFDGDARAYFPLPLSQRNRMTLGPLAGFAVHTSRIQAQAEVEGETFTACKTRAFSPVVGLALGLEPTCNFSIRTSLAFEFPAFSQRATPSEHDEGPTGDMGSWERLRMKRLALSTSINLIYALSERLSLEGAVDSYCHSLVDADPSEKNYDSNYANRIKGTIGAQWRF